MTMSQLTALDTGDDDDDDDGQDYFAGGAKSRYVGAVFRFLNFCAKVFFEFLAKEAKLGSKSRNKSHANKSNSYFLLK